MRKGDEKDFTVTDAQIFPPQNNPMLVSEQDVVISAAVETDEREIQTAKNVIKAALDIGVAVIIALVVASAAPAAAPILATIVPAVFAANFLVDAAMAPLQNTVPLVDPVVVLAGIEGDVRDLDGNRVLRLSYTETERKGPGPFEYEIRDLAVDTKSA